MTDEVEQIIEPEVGIIDRPMVQLGLHPSYPQPDPIRVCSQLTGIHQRLRLLQFLDYMNPLGPSAMCEAFPARTTTALGSASGRQRTTRLPARHTWRVRRISGSEMVPTFTLIPGRLSLDPPRK